MGGSRKTLPPPPRRETLPALSATRPLEPNAVPTIELTVIREGGLPSNRKVLFDGDHFRIGSHPSNDLTLSDPRVSRFHCQLVHDRTRWRVADSGSLNGTRIGGVTIRDADVPLPDAHIEIGDSIVVARPLAAKRVDVLPAVVSFGSLQGKSEPMRRLFATIERVAQTDATILIEGESGSGKELVATEIVRRGRRCDGPLVVIDCGAISPQLMESTLFGHNRGAFTGAERDREGAFEAAAGGTVFLDEIGELPLDMQPKLLRAIESRAICRVGDTRHRPVDVRIIAATNRELAREVNHGRFREDLYFRLSVVTVHVPPLRERLDDLELLVRALADHHGAPGTDRLFSPEVIERLAEHDWPGNVRELRNYVERTVVLKHTDTTFDHAFAPLASAGGADPLHVTAPIDVSVPFKQAKETLVADFEKKYIEALLASSDGNVSRAARKADMDRINLHRLIQRHDVRATRSMKD